MARSVPSSAGRDAGGHPRHDDRGHARNEALALATRDVREFERMASLRVANWVWSCRFQRLLGQRARRPGKRSGATSRQ
jgi:hypothetical protein